MLWGREMPRSAFPYTSPCAVGGEHPLHQGAPYTTPGNFPKRAVLFGNTVVVLGFLFLDAALFGEEQRGLFGGLCGLPTGNGNQRTKAHLDLYPSLGHQSDFTTTAKVLDRHSQCKSTTCDDIWNQNRSGGNYSEFRILAFGRKHQEYVCITWKPSLCMDLPLSDGKV